MKPVNAGLDDDKTVPKMAGQEGIEPTTCGFGDRCSAN